MREENWENPSRPAQVRAFARRTRLVIPTEPGAEFVSLLGAFLLPLLDDLRQGADYKGTWAPRGSWQ